MINSISTSSFAPQLEQLKFQQNLETVQKSDSRDISSDFSSMMTKMVADVDNTQKVSDTAMKDLAAGNNNTSVQDVVMKMEQAELSFKLMLEIRNKLMSCYREVIMQE